MGNNSRFFFVLLSVSAAIGLGNIWLYPYFSYQWKGLFIIPYIIALFILGLPLLILEFSIGQYFNKNIIDLFHSVRRWFSAIGWLMIFNALIVFCYFAVVLSWHIIYFFASFGLQWKNEPKAYFFNNVLQVSDGFNNFLSFSLPVFIAFIISCLVIFFFIRNGFESMKKLLLFLMPFFVFLMCIFFVYSLTLDNALNGIYVFLKPELGSLMQIDAWASAFLLAALSLGLSFGIMPVIASKSGKGFVLGNSAIVIVIKLMLGIAFNFIVFGIIGFLSLRQGINIDVSSDYSSSFITMAQALPFFYKPTLLSLLFFLFLSIFFVIGAASLAYSISHVLVHKFSTKKMNAAIVTIGFGFLFGLIFTLKPGFYIMDIANHFIYYNILIAILLEVLAIGWFFDAEKIKEHINHYSKIKFGGLWHFMIKYVMPLIVGLLLFFLIKSDFHLNYKGYPLWALLVFGVGTVAIPLTIAFLMPQKILDRR